MMCFLITCCFLSPPHTLQVSLIMELADYSLAERLQVCMAQPASAKDSSEGGPMSMRELLSVSYDITSGLAALHASGVIHRDLKPQVG